MTQRGPAPFNPLAVTQQPLDTPLARLLAERIHQRGPLSFAAWMDACLYHPQHGYYCRGQPTVGRDGDFLTSPEVHPLFGAAVAHAAAALWRHSGQPDPFTIAEVGPGSGALAESALRHLHATAPECAAAIHYTLIEPDPAAARRQTERLQPLHPPAQIHSLDSLRRLEQLPPDHHLILANELLDALPVHRLSFRDGQWRELFVNHSPELGFHELPGALTDARLLEPLCTVSASEGQLVEIAPDRAAVVTTLAHAVGQNGVLLLFDYGYPRARLYAPWRRDGTLMTFRNHIPGDDPYARPGEQDITTHIDIDQVREAAIAAGLTPLPPLSQAEWLHNLGAAVLPAVADAGAHVGSDTNRYLTARRAVETLTDPAGLGRIAVLAFARGPAPRLPGWNTGNTP